MTIPELLRRQILCAQINVKLAREFTHVAPSERLAEIESRTEVLNDLLAQVNP
jgi:hypothetical protein